MTNTIHTIPVATPEQVAGGWDGIYRDQNGDWYIVPVDPADLTGCEGCE